jgi:hypothetical protein
MLGTKKPLERDVLHDKYSRPKLTSDFADATLAYTKLSKSARHQKGD